MHASVLTFWFEETSPAQRWKVDAAFDAQIHTRWHALHTRAHRGELAEWRATPRGRLAEIIVLDQFSRNMFRNTPAAFASDALALSLAQDAVATGADQTLTPEERVFIYMPYMHSESREVHETAIALFTQLAFGNHLDFEVRHKAIIDRFDRYPHRNAILGRASSDEEIAFLKEPGSHF
jgi:uncharacterized protein (DUF924 family)